MNGSFAVQATISLLCSELETRINLLDFQIKRDILESYIVIFLHLKKSK